MCSLVAGRLSRSRSRRESRGGETPEKDKIQQTSYHQHDQVRRDYTKTQYFHRGERCMYTLTECVREVVKINEEEERRVD